MRMVAVVWALGALCASALPLSGCGRTECAAPDDLSGRWRGEYRTQAGDSADLELSLEQDGALLRGSYSLSSGGMGTIRGLRIGKRIEFDAKQTTTGCTGDLRGLANICGERMALTLNGSDCRGDKRGRANLRYQRPVTGAAGNRGGAAGSRGGAGGMPGTGGQPPPPCRSVNDGVCDEPEGTGSCPEGSDPQDCLAMQPPPSGMCPFQGNGTCDEPEGSGLCEEGTDAADCGEIDFYCNTMPCKLPDAPPLDPTGRRASGCCYGPYSCGFTLGAGCYELVQGMPDRVCSQKLAAQWPGGGMGLGACCRPDGRCGLALEGLGCVVPEALYALPAIDIPNFTCADADADAGVP